MNKVTSVVLACLLVVVLSVASFAAPGCDTEKARELADEYLSNMPNNGYYVSADDVMKRIESGKNDFVIVDVRETIEKYRSGHIPGAIYINYKDMAKQDNLAKLPKDKDILLYCNTGHEESKVLTVLRMLGFKAFGLKFGYMAWKKETPTDVTLGVIQSAARKNYPIETVSSYTLVH